MAKAELASASHSQCIQGRREHSPPGLPFRDAGFSRSSTLRLGFKHPTLAFPFPPGLLGGPPGWGSRSLHHLQLHPVPASQDLLGETRHLQGLRARGGLGRARGPAAAVGGAALPTEPPQGDVREGLTQTSLQDERGAGEHCICPRAGAWPVPCLSPLPLHFCFFI